MTTALDSRVTREHLLHALYEAAELEHNLMCTYLYAAFSLKGADEGLTPEQAEAVTRWRGALMKVAIEEMGHLTAVWNITSALGGAPRVGRANFPLDPGMLPAGIVVKLAPFGPDVLQHFIHLERPEGADAPEGAGFENEVAFIRGSPRPSLTPMAIDYETVGVFYARLEEDLKAFVAEHGDAAAFCGDPALQLSGDEVALFGAKPVICLKTALAALDAIVEQGEGAGEDHPNSHYNAFLAVRREYDALRAQDPSFAPAYPAAVNPVLRRPVRPGRVWIEEARAAATVDLANTCYALMLRLLAYAYATPRGAAEKALAVDIARGLMRAMTLTGEHAARLPAGPANPECHAGMSFTTLRDAATLPPGPAAERFFIERLRELASAAETALAADASPRLEGAAKILRELAVRCARAFEAPRAAPAPRTAPAPAPAVAPGQTPIPVVVDGVEEIAGATQTLIFDGKKCIHSRFCVTGAPTVFLANVEGPWIRPDAIAPEALREIAHVCPSGAIRYRRTDGGPDETAPPVNLISLREAGPYAVRGDIRMAGEAIGYRATLCRCGASKHKPFCDGSHHDVHFDASGEPASGQTDMLAVRDGPLAIEPVTDGPLQVRGNLEITSGTGRVVSRVTSARLCRCGASATKPFCDGSHARVGFKS